jgi:hypothetical protein
MTPTKLLISTTRTQIKVSDELTDDELLAMIDELARKLQAREDSKCLKA